MITYEAVSKVLCGKI